MFLDGLLFCGADEMRVGTVCSPLFEDFAAGADDGQFHVT